MAAGNKTYKHVNSAQAGLIVSPNPGAILGDIVINTPSTGASGGILTIYDGQDTGGKVVAVADTKNATIPGLSYNIVMSGGIFITFTAGATTTADLTITYQ